MKASVFFLTKIWKTFLSLSYAMRIFSLFLSVFSSFFFLLLHLIRQISLGNLFFPIESLCQQHARTITRNQKKLIIIIIIKNWREEKKSGGVLLFSFPPLYFSLWNISSWSLAMIKEIFNVLNGGGGGGTGLSSWQKEVLKIYVHTYTKGLSHDHIRPGIANRKKKNKQEHHMSSALKRQNFFRRCV